MLRRSTRLGFVAEAPRSAAEIAPELAPEELDEPSGSVSLDLERAQRAGYQDAERRVGDPAAEWAGRRQEPAYPGMLQSVAQRDIVAERRTAARRIHRLANVHATICRQLPGLAAALAGLRAERAELGRARTNVFGEYHLAFIALVAALGGALELTMINLSVLWLDLPEPSEYRLVALVVSVSMSAGAVTAAIVHRPDPERAGLPLPVRAAAGLVIGLLTLALLELHGLPGIVEGRSWWAHLGYGTVAVLAGLCAFAVRRLPPVTSLIVLAVMVAGLFSLARLRGSDALMFEPTHLERAYGTIGLGAAAFAANLAIWALTEAALRCRHEHLRGCRVETVEALIDEVTDRLTLAELVRDGADQMVEELREDAHGAIDGHLNDLAAALSAYSRGHQRHHAEVAPDLSGQIARIERDAADAATTQHEHLDDRADHALARIAGLTEEENDD
jgi:hypothetical protein